MKIKIYTTTYCGYCLLAKSLLRRRGIAFEEIDCTRDPGTRLWLLEQSGQRTVPQIFIGERPIGGYRELSKLDRDGSLASMV